MNWKGLCQSIQNTTYTIFPIKDEQFSKCWHPEQNDRVLAWHFSGNIDAPFKKEFKHESHACWGSKLRESNAFQFLILQNVFFALVKKQQKKNKKKKQNMKETLLII